MPSEGVADVRSDYRIENKVEMFVSQHLLDSVVTKSTGDGYFGHFLKPFDERQFRLSRLFHDALKEVFPVTVSIWDGEVDLHVYDNFSDVCDVRQLFSSSAGNKRYVVPSIRQSQHERDHGVFVTCGRVRHDSQNSGGITRVGEKNNV